MESVQFSAAAPPGAGDRTLITRVDELRWHATEDDQVIGYSEATVRPDGRLSLSVDTWLGVVFDQLAAAMVADLPGRLYTLVDDSDADITSRWERAGLTVRRREREYRVVTDLAVNGLGDVSVPSGVTILPLGAPEEPLLREVYEAVRAEVDAEAGWDTMPIEMPPRPAGAPMDTSRYAVAAGADRYEGLVRVVMRRKNARIGLVAVRVSHRRRGIARAMLAEVLDALHRDGFDRAVIEVDAANAAGQALVDGLGARLTGSTVELVRG